MTGESRIALVGKYIALLAYMLFLVAPLAWLLSTSFKSSQELMRVVVSWVPQDFTLTNYIAAFTEQPILKSMGNSLLIAGSSAAVTAVLAVPAAYMLARRRGVTSTITMGWVLASQMFPFILVVVPLFLVLIRLGLYDTRIGLVLVYVVWNLPFVLWMLRNYVLTIPLEVEQAAAIDRAGEGVASCQGLRGDGPRYVPSSGLHVLTTPALCR